MDEYMFELQIYEANVRAARGGGVMGQGVIDAAYARLQEQHAKLPAEERVNTKLPTRGCAGDDDEYHDVLCAVGNLHKELKRDK